MAVIQWVYASAASTPFDSSDLEDLLAKARANNEKVNVTGMLLYHDGSFLQVLEGEEDDVEAVVSKIKQDDRHCNVMKLYRGEIDAPNFADWSMGFCRPTNAKDVPGFIDILRSVDTHDLCVEGNGTRVKKLIDAFKEGRWRQKVAA
ncbi:MAG: BLUF domain-containing protein [Geminicoccaceae bacterium]